MQNRDFLLFEDVVEDIKRGYYNEFAQLSHDWNIRAIIFYMSQNQAGIKETAAYFEIEEVDVKESIKNFVLQCDKLSDVFANHESFSKREGR